MLNNIFDCNKIYLIKCYNMKHIFNKKSLKESSLSWLFLNTLKYTLKFTLK